MHTDFHFNFSQCFTSSKNRAEIQTQIFLSHSTTQTKIGQLFFTNWGSEGRSGCDSLGKSWDLNPDHGSPAPQGTSFCEFRHVSESLWISDEEAYKGI